jgi:protein SCO1
MAAMAEAFASEASEDSFAALVDALAADPARRGELVGLLREDHPVYDQRGAATVVRMRGWVLLALARIGLPDAALLYVLEELDAGVDAYLVAAAARALRSYREPDAAFAPFLTRALGNIRYHDEPVSFEGYGEYAAGSNGTSPVREVLAALAWLGPRARGSLADLEAVRAQPRGLSRKRLADLDQALDAIRAGDREAGTEECCALPGGLTSTFSWARGSRRDTGPVEATVFEDQEGTVASFQELFRGHPTIVAFFYTRCDNPLKCSLTVTKLARVQKLLAERGLAGRVHTMAITYDPLYDIPERLLRYGQSRGLRLDAGHRMLRATSGFDALRRHFQLGVSFVESLVNRHRIEVFVLDAEGRIAASFERLHWDEQRVVERAAEVLEEKAEEPAPPARRKAASPVLGTLASLGVAFFPKCPVCWAAYLSLFGVASLERVPYSPWLQPVLAAVMLINLASLWFRGRSTGRMGGFYLAAAGALAIFASRVGAGLEGAAVWGVGLTVAGSVVSVWRRKKAAPRMTAVTR